MTDKKVNRSVVIHPDRQKGCFASGVFHTYALHWNDVAPCPHGQIVVCGVCDKHGICPYEGIENLRALMPWAEVAEADGMVVVTLKVVAG